MAKIFRLSSIHTTREKGGTEFGIGFKFESLEGGTARGAMTFSIDCTTQDVVEGLRKLADDILAQSMAAE